MLATTIESPQEINLRDPALLYEPKLDGIRGLILIEPAQPSPRITTRPISFRKWCAG
jgi:ATP-dependent DNA ligase